MDTATMHRATMQTSARTFPARRLQIVWDVLTAMVMATRTQTSPGRQLKGQTPSWPTQPNGLTKTAISLVITPMANAPMLVQRFVAPRSLTDSVVKTATATVSQMSPPIGRWNKVLMRARSPTATQAPIASVALTRTATTTPTLRPIIALKTVLTPIQTTQHVGFSNLRKKVHSSPRPPHSSVEVSGYWSYWPCLGS